MLSWKKELFVNVTKIRMDKEKRTKEEIIKEYIKLTEEEINEILKEIK